MKARRRLALSEEMSRSNTSYEFARIIDNEPVPACRFEQHADDGHVMIDGPALRKRAELRTVSRKMLLW